MIEQKTLVVMACVLVAALLVWKELARKNRSGVFFRLLASLLAVGSLALFIIPVYHTTSVRAGTQFLLTPGYDSAYVSRETAADSSLKVFTFDPAIYRSTHSVFKTQIGRKDFDHLQILGWGPANDELENMTVDYAGFYAPALPAGLQSVSWTPTLKSGEDFVVQGSYRAKQAERLLLVGNGKVLDSIAVPSGADSIFSLRFPPRQAGRDIYSLVAVSAKDSLFNEPMPFELLPAEPLRVLLLANLPGFETRFLRNWLSDNRYTVASRIRITKGKFLQEFSNMPERSLSRVSSSLLAASDLVIADAAELRELSQDERSAIQSAVEERGVGLVVRADSIADKLFYSGGMHPVAINRNQTILHWSGREQSTLPVALNTAVSLNNTAIPLVLDQEKSAFATVRLAGNGKVVYTTLDNTYMWPLSGLKQPYASLWTLLLQSAVRSSGEELKLNTRPSLPVENQSVRISVNRPEFQIEGKRIAPATNLIDPEIKQGNYLPLTTGWKMVQSGDTAKAYFFVYRSGDWQQIRNLERMNQTRAFVGRQHRIGKGQSPVPAQKRFPVYPFVMVFLVAMTYLWLENKYAGSA